MQRGWRTSSTGKGTPSTTIQRSSTPNGLFFKAKIVKKEVI
jgi:hypothetical protein